jgi:hypothetical protein
MPALPLKADINRRKTAPGNVEKLNPDLMLK